MIPLQIILRSCRAKVTFYRPLLERQTKSTKVLARCASTQQDIEKGLMPPSKILYGSNNEDVATEKYLLRKHDSNDLKVFTICGGGDNYMALLADPLVESVTCVDMNPIPLALAQVKLALACSDLSTQHVLGFLGMNDSIKDRLDVYGNVVEPYLPSHVAKSVRKHLLNEVRTGVALYGSGENMCRHLNRVLVEKGFEEEALWNGTVDMDAFERVCKEGIGRPEDMAIAGRILQDMPETYTQLWNDVCFPRACRGYYRVVEAGIHNFLTSILIRVKYDETTLPDWLLPHVRDALREKREQVIFVESSVVDVPPQEYDLVTPSNIFDWMDKDTAATTLETVADRYLSPNGYLLLRLAFSDTKALVDAVPNLKMCNKVLPEHLANVEQSPLWFQNAQGLAALRLS